MAETPYEKVIISPKNGLSYVAGDTSNPLIEKTIPEISRETVAKFGPGDALAGDALAGDALAGDALAGDALVIPARNVALSYYDLDLLVSGLWAPGLEKGDRTGIWSPNNPE